MAKTAMLTVRLEPEIKSEAEDMLERLGIPASNAIKMFYQQIIFHRGLPFAVTLPSRRPRDIADMAAEELDAEMERGHADVLAGRVRPAGDVFADIRKRILRGDAMTSRKLSASWTFRRGADVIRQRAVPARILFVATGRRRGSSCRRRPRRG